MKWMKAVACTALLALSGPAFCDEVPAESPRDYAFGRSLDTSVPSRWYRVMLPLAVYEQSTSADLHDVRVFNQSGEPVPFSLIAATRPQDTAHSTALRLFPLDASPLAQTPVTAIRSCCVPETALRLCWRGKKPPQPDNITC